MALVCSRCNSSYLVEDYDPEEHRMIGYRCGSCGRNDFIEIIQKEKPMASHPTCQAEGCTKIVVKDHLCILHYKEKYGASPKPVCTVDGCDSYAVLRGMCNRHITEIEGPTPPGQGRNKHAICSREGCTKQVVGEGLCYRHLTEKHGGVNPLRHQYRHRKHDRPDPDKRDRFIPDQHLRGKPPLAAAVDPDPNVVMAAPRQVHPPHHPRASLAQEIYEITDGNGRKATIAFTYIDAKKTFAECCCKKFNYEPGPSVIHDYDDWMFFGAIADEIRRIQEGG